MKLIKQHTISLINKLKNATRKDWKFHCPYCKQVTTGKLICRPMFTQSCRQCKRTFLAINVKGQARAVQHPKCDQGCDYYEPYGWVISADCELHDPLPG